MESLTQYYNSYPQSVPTEKTNEFDSNDRLNRAFFFRSPPRYRWFIIPHSLEALFYQPYTEGVLPRWHEYTNEPKFIGTWSQKPLAGKYVFHYAMSLPSNKSSCWVPGIRRGPIINVITAEGAFDLFWERFFYVYSTGGSRESIQSLAEDPLIFR